MHDKLLKLKLNLILRDKYPLRQQHWILQPVRNKGYIENSYNNFCIVYNVQSILRIQESSKNLQPRHI